MQLGAHGGKNQAFMLVGPPGVGKTLGLEAIARALSSRLGYDFPSEIWSGPQIQAEDAAGLPVPDLESGTTRLLPLRLGDKVMPARAGVLCIDEFGSISPSQEAAFLNLLQGGRLGERTVPSTVALGAMMNPEDCASNARGLSAAAANRFLWINWRLDIGTWLDYMRGGQGFGVNVDVLKPNWEAKFGSQTKSIIASYIKRNPSCLLRVPQAHNAGVAWPSPRSWDAASRVMAAIMSCGERKESDLVHLAVEGCVGKGDAESFMGWLIDSKLPDPEELLANPKEAPKLFPERNDHLTVTMEAVATAAMQNMNDEVKERERYKAAWDIIGPVFLKQNDVGLPGAILLSERIPKGFTEFHPAVKQVEAILRKAGMKD
jgi:DNA polymerase III delta prime subunit